MDTIYLAVTVSSFGIGFLLLIGGIFDLDFIDSSKDIASRESDARTQKRAGAIVAGVILVIFGIICFVKR